MPEPPCGSLAWVHGAAKIQKLAIPVSILVGITAVSGAFVAGNDAVCNYCKLYFHHLSILHIHYLIEHLLDPTDWTVHVRSTFQSSQLFTLHHGE